METTLNQWLNNPLPRYSTVLIRASTPAIPEPIDFSHAFLVVALFTLSAAPIALWMPRNAGDDLTGRRSVPAQPVRGGAAD